MNPNEKFLLNNRLSYLAIGALISCFSLGLASLALPEFSLSPSGASEQRLLVSIWTSAGTLMWITIFRIQIFHRLSDLIGRKKATRGVTPWIKFWFGASLFAGSVTLFHLFQSYRGSAVVEVHKEALTLLSSAAWVGLVALSILLFRSRDIGSKKMLGHVRGAYQTHRLLLAPASLLFFFSTIALPMFFLLPS